MRTTLLVRLCSGVLSYAEFDVHCCPGASCRITLGIGSRLSIACPSGLMRSSGMTLFGNATPVLGSMIGWMVPFVMRVCEKSPARSSAVGRLDRAVTLGRASSVYSCDTKKYVLLFIFRLSYTFGITSGPPKL